MATEKHSPTPENITTEDPDTAAARKELDQTAISDKPNLSAMPSSPQAEAAASAPKPTTSTAGSDSAKASTPDRESAEGRSDSNNTAKDQLASPKKKRAHAEVDEPKDTIDITGSAHPVMAPNGSSATTTSRSERSEPEKKRPRDVSSEVKPGVEGQTASSVPKQATTVSDKEGESAAKNAANEKSTQPEKSTDKSTKLTSDSAFKSSGMAGFASSASPFLQAGGGKPLASFGSSSASPSPFGLTSTSTTSVFGSTNGSSSPFGQVGTSTAPKPFGGSAFGGSGFGGAKLSNFGTPGTSLKSSKPARPFGAPVSEDEDDKSEGEDDDKSENENDDDQNRDKDSEADKSVAGDDVKKAKLQRVIVDDGETAETTILAVRAKLYSLDKATKSWKERGAGNLKINVPLPCVDIDEGTGGAIPGSFDASALEDADSKVVRLLMRQDATHRVILNTAVIPAMKFQEKSSLKATFILFTAVEDGGAVSMQMKVCLHASSRHGCRNLMATTC
ncbi:hypothetical protein F5Y15DRAFT_120475 [Xylariaceae sp. FL0016]|nr:hypothetical protein F5Y15DRAFT_120475 [Xylariaceae sp. FL0016]